MDPICYGTPKWDVLYVYFGIAMLTVGIIILTLIFFRFAIPSASDNTIVLTCMVIGTIAPIYFLWARFNDIRKCIPKPKESN